MTIILPGELEEMIQHHVDQGHYPSAVEVVRAALTLLGEQEQRDRHEDQNGDSAIEGQQTMTDQPDPNRDYGAAWAKWFQDLESPEPPMERTTVKPSKSEIEAIIIEKYRKQGLEL